MNNYYRSYGITCYNEDCISGCKNHIKDNSIDLIITDPPFGIKGDTLHKHYCRDESKILNGYVEIDEKEYPEFTNKWIEEAERILKPGGSIYIFSGYTNLRHILNSLVETSLKEINHIIWKYNFGVYTKNKYVSSHYHILYYVKSEKKSTFNTYCRFNKDEYNSYGRSLNYFDREDVWIINRDNKPKNVRNKNTLPSKIIEKIIQYSSNESNLICDLFSGSFIVADIANKLKRRFIGFELNKISYDYYISLLNKDRHNG